MPKVTPRRAPERATLAVALARLPPTAATLQFSARLPMAPAMPLLRSHSRPSESPSCNPNAASSDVRPNFQRAPALLAAGSSRSTASSLSLFHTGNAAWSSPAPGDCACTARACVPAASAMASRNVVSKGEVRKDIVSMDRLRTGKFPSSGAL